MILYIALYRQIIAKFLVAYIFVIWLALDYIYLWVGVLIMIYSAAIFAYIYTQNMLKKALCLRKHSFLIQLFKWLF